MRKLVISKELHRGYLGQFYRLMEYTDHDSVVSWENTTFWYKDNVIHSYGDKPAYIHHNGYKAWYKDGLLHRDDEPAVIWHDGTEEWYLNGIKQATKNR